MVRWRSPLTNRSGDAHLDPDFCDKEGTVIRHRRSLAKPEDRNAMISESIARKLKLAANKELAQRYERRMRRARQFQDRSGHIEVANKMKRVERSNGLLDD